jgi:heptose I phosphotransferase
LRVNCAFAEILRENGLTTFKALMAQPPVEIARHVGERLTGRLVLQAGDGTRAFYIKRHGPARWREWIKPFLRLTRPVLGAQPEWDAMLRFHAAGIPTMTPVALGRSGRRSFVVTEALDDCERLDHWVVANQAERPQETQQLVGLVAQMTRTMHQAGMHHQDFYLCHLLLPSHGPRRVHVIDLGRVRPHSHLASRWIVKDLAQLQYSAGPLSFRERLRFLRLYLGRRLERGDRRLIRRIQRKAAAIARHSRKNRL